MIKEGQLVNLKEIDQAMKVLLEADDCEIGTRYVVQSLDGRHTTIVFEDDVITEAETPSEAFARKPEEAKQFALMQTMQRCQEVFALLEAEGKIDSEKIGSIDWYDESQFKIDLCREYENTYCETPAYEESYTDSTEQFFRIKLLERFGKVPPVKYYRCEVTQTYQFDVYAKDKDAVNELLDQIESDDNILRQIGENSTLILDCDSKLKEIGVNEADNPYSLLKGGEQ